MPGFDLFAVCSPNGQPGISGLPGIAKSAACNLKSFPVYDGIQAGIPATGNRPAGRPAQLRVAAGAKPSEIRNALIDLIASGETAGGRQHRLTACRSRDRTGVPTFQIDQALANDAGEVHRIDPCRSNGPYH